VKILIFTPGESIIFQFTTNEIAQTEAATGKHPWVTYWLHNEFLIMDKGKMSKSAGGFITLKDLIDKGFDPLDYRYFLLGGHYRSQLQFSWAALEGARNSRRSLLEKLRALARKAPDFKPQAKKAAEGGSSPVGGSQKYLVAFNKALEDDLSTPRALAELWGLLRDNEVEAKSALETALVMDTVLGLNLEEALGTEENSPIEDPAGSAELAREVEALIVRRAEAKKAKNFALADEIRNRLKERGIELSDSPTGTTWKRV